MNLFKKISKIFVIISCLTYYLTLDFIPYRSSPEWYMFFSSSMVCPIVGLLLCIFEKHKKSDFILLLFILSAVIFNGSRGSLIQIALFLVLYFVFNKKFTKGLFYISLSICILIGILSYFANNSQFMTLIRDSRTLSLLFDGAISNDSGRTYGYKLILNYFFSLSPFEMLFGLGIAGDRYYISNYAFPAGYPHQFFIEILLHFGIIGSVIILICILVISLKAVKLSFGQPYLADICSIFLCVLSILMISSSYLLSNSLFLWIGFCLCLIIDKNKYHTEKLTNIR